MWSLLLVLIVKYLLPLAILVAMGSYFFHASQWLGGWLWRLTRRTLIPGRR